MNIILAHGVLGFRNIAIIDYFNGVRGHLEATFSGIPIRILITEVDPIAGVVARGRSLAAQVLDAFTGGTIDSGDTTHIIAHSMGGLDARVILSPTNPENIAARVSSLTTISTPHQGSPVADLLFQGFDGQAPNLFARTMEKRLRQVIEELDISLQGLEDLTTNATRIFNENFPDNNSVRYFSIAGQGREGVHKTSKPFLLSHLYIETVTGEKNDGMVTISSATRGENETILWPGDHADEVGHDLDRGPLVEVEHFDYKAEYSRIVEHLLQI